MATVSVTSKEGFQNEVCYADGRSFIIDEPASVGGAGAGPDPYSLLLAALGGCTSMTVKMYAKRKGWKLERVTVKLDQARKHAQDCEDCETKAGAFVHGIEFSVELEGDLTEEQRARLLEIAHKCPVKKTLTSEIIIEHVKK